MRERFNYSAFLEHPWNHWWTEEKQAFWANREQFWIKGTIKKSPHLEQATEEYVNLKDEKIFWEFKNQLRKVWDFPVFEKVYQGVLALSLEVQAKYAESSYERTAWDKIVQTLVDTKPVSWRRRTLFNVAIGENLSRQMQQDWKNIFGIGGLTFHREEEWQAALVRCTIFEQYTFEFSESIILLYGMPEYPRKFYFGSEAQHRAKELPWDTDAVCRF